MPFRFCTRNRNNCKAVLKIFPVFSSACLWEDRKSGHEDVLLSKKIVFEAMSSFFFFLKYIGIYIGISPSICRFGFG